MVSDDGYEPTFGPIETQVRRDVDALIIAHPMGEALAEMSYSLARSLDDRRMSGMPRAAVNRELRMNLIELAGMGVDDDDLDQQLSTPDVPSPIRDPEDD